MVQICKQIHMHGNVSADQFKVTVTAWHPAGTEWLTAKCYNVSPIKVTASTKRQYVQVDIMLRNRLLGCIRRIDL